MSYIDTRYRTISKADPRIGLRFARYPRVLWHHITSQGESMKKQKGFSLIELLIVVAIILIIAAIATAEVTYSSSWGSGFSVDLPSLGGAAPCNVASAAAACLIDSLLSVAPNTKSGYRFNAAGTKLVGTVYNGFEVNSWPSTYQTTGVRSFCDDQTGVLKFAVNGGAAIGVAVDTCSNLATVAGVSGPIGN